MLYSCTSINGYISFRFMYSLKKKVRNKACVEGSIAEAYLKEEMVTFCSLYLDEDFETQFTKKSRNFDGGDVSFYDSLSIFSQPGRATNASSRRYVSDEEYHASCLTFSQIVKKLNLILESSMKR